MRAAMVAVGMAVLLGGCETFEETYTIEQDTLIDEGGVQVTSDLQEDFFGERWFQFRAYNSNSFPVCVQVSLKDGSYTNGHSMGALHRVDSGTSVDVGYINTPADFNVSARVTTTNGSGACS
jgi:hypothetical protein